MPFYSQKEASVPPPAQGMSGDRVSPEQQLDKMNT